MTRGLSLTNFFKSAAVDSALAKGQKVVGKAGARRLGVLLDLRGGRVAEGNVKGEVCCGYT